MDCRGIEVAASFEKLVLLQRKLAEDHVVYLKERSSIENLR
jgi:hypothetical protein